MQLRSIGEGERKKYWPWRHILKQPNRIPIWRTNEENKKYKSMKWRARETDSERDRET